MLPDTIVSESIDISPGNLAASGLFRAPDKQRIVTWALVLGLFVAALLVRLYTLDLPFDRDSYDEGVYWQSLRAMSAGSALYRDIFYSQPPFFLLSLYPIYMFGGQTLWSARLGVALISLCGFVGVGLLGRTLAGRLGMLFALSLLLADPLYLRGSQTLQADAPALALSLLAVGMAYRWWCKPVGQLGLLPGILAASILALGILSKLLALATLAPIGLIVFARLMMLRQNRDATTGTILTLIASVLAFFLTILLLLLPCSEGLHELWSSVVTFHTDAKASLAGWQSYNVTPDLFGILKTLLPLSALYGTITALSRRDWRVVPLLAWLLATIVQLWQQVPLFPHHLIALIPPLVALAVMGIHPTHPAGRINFQRIRSLLSLRNLLPHLHTPTATTGIALALLLLTDLLSLNGVRHYYDAMQMRKDSVIAQHEEQIMRDLRRVVPPGKFVLTDAPFFAASTGHSTPAALVDLSEVRIRAGYISTTRLIQEASRPDVQVVLLYGSTRLYRLTAFRAWLKQHFRRIAVYDQDQYETLWGRI
jgi:4-amino-4-deoxy-L-arabinose transferase-like glycosyltransferase